MKKKPSFTKKRVIVSIVVFFSVGLLGWGGWVLFEPHPLERIGSVLIAAKSTSFS